MKLIIAMLIGMILLALLVKADTVNMEINVNGTSNLNITVNADDTLARAMINETQTDTYGTMHNSGPKDMILEEIKSGAGNPVNGAEGLTAINEICNDLYLQQYLNQIGNLPPEGFVNYVKALGYDDESHINLIWTMCQQEYINQHQNSWSQDLIGGGIQQGDLFTILKAAIDWLNGNGESIYIKAKDIGKVLDSYFASDKDVWTLSNKIKSLELRVEALERTAEEIAAEAYCQAKIDMMGDYNLTGVKCGTNSTMYWNAKRAGFDNYDIISYKTCDEDWICTDWSECIDGKQNRKCVDKNDCGSFDAKPLEIMECKNLEQKEVKASQVGAQPPEETPTTVVEEVQSKSLIRGLGPIAFLLALNTKEWAASLIIGIIVALIIIFFLRRSHKKIQNFINP